MSSTTLDSYCQPNLVNEREVAAFLCRYPDFFERHPEILTELSIPHPDSGQAVSLLERQLTALRAQLSPERYRPGMDTTFLEFVGAFISATCRRTGIS